MSDCCPNPDCTWVWAVMRIGDRHESWRLRQHVADSGGPWFVLEDGKPTEAVLVRVEADDASVDEHDREAYALGFDPAQVLRIAFRGDPKDSTAIVTLTTGETQTVNVRGARPFNPSRAAMLRLYEQLRKQETTVGEKAGGSEPQ